MKTFLRLSVILSALAVALPGLHAAGDGAPQATPTTPGATEPMLAFSLPANLKIEDVVAAVTKSFQTHKWTGIAAEKNTVNASIKLHEVSVSAHAVCSSTDVKIFAEYKTDAKVAQEKARGMTLRWLHNLEAGTKDALGLLPKKAENERK
jgi:hypothetical protein